MPVLRGGGKASRDGESDSGIDRDAKEDEAHC